MKKILAITLVFLLAAICCVGCTRGSYTFINSNENSGAKFWEASYDKFDGYKQREINISGEDERVFTVEIETISGSLALSIEDGDGTSLYNGNEIPSSSFEVETNGEGKYIVRFDADNHSGSFGIKWE